MTQDNKAGMISLWIPRYGSATKGRLWKLNRMIVRIANSLDQLPYMKEPHGSLTLHQWKRLTQLACELQSLSHVPLARFLGI